MEVNGWSLGDSDIVDSNTVADSVVMFGYLIVKVAVNSSGEDDSVNDFVDNFSCDLDINDWYCM